MSQRIQFFEKDPDDLINEIAQEVTKQVVDAIKLQIPQNLKPPAPTQKEEYLTTKETVKRLKVTPSTLWAWRKKGVIQAFGVEHRVFFKSSEVDALLKPISLN